ncbi:hypothetical protein BpHYR1_002809 [Brachionus plicatilis]|uniref:Uncharacterized protein n=1 Tax=Brachionus plicatilis TaxID=10195 RepID=A0A3M7RCT9_BRAPC|nr:hypothetical protein BpHYR1_002809 [Brachionus plicatilis]
MNKPATNERSIFYLDSLASEIKYSFICHPFVGVTYANTFLPFLHNPDWTETWVWTSEKCLKSTHQTIKILLLRNFINSSHDIKFEIQDIFGVQVSDRFIRLQSITGYPE